MNMMSSIAFETDVISKDVKMTGLTVENVSVTYRNGHSALEKVTFSLPAATITALVGVNGSGKSTLFKAIMGFAPVSQGSTTIFGKTVKEALKGNLVAYVPQNEDVDWTFPVLVEDVVMMGRFGHMGFLRRPGKQDHDSVNQALERVGLADFRKRQIGELSGGQKKRVFLARAMAQEGRVILLDEPFNGIDVNSEAAIIDLLRVMRDEGRVVLVSTHDLGMAPEYCDHAVLLNRTVLAFGPIQEVFTRKNLEKTFGSALKHVVLPHQTDETPQIIGVITDHEKPLVMYSDKLSGASSDKKS